MRLISRNSDIGLRLANLVVIDCERTLSNRDPRWRREAKASSGTCKRDILEDFSQREDLEVI